MKGERLLGLRLQIVLSLALLLTVSFGPLYLAVSRISRSTLTVLREKDATTIARAVAAHVADVADGTNTRLGSVLMSHVGPDGASTIVVLGRDGSFVAGVGDETAIAKIKRSPPAAQESARLTDGRVEVVVPKDTLSIVVQVETNDATSLSKPLVQLFALYMGLFALLLLIFSYFVLTRLIVRPIDRLVQLTSKVAQGNTHFTISTAGAKELVNLANSIDMMTKSLLAKEEAMRNKVTELTAARRELQHTETQLAGSERLASVGRLAAGVAHEIGNPIAAILGMEDLLIEGGLEPTEEKDFLRRMKKETERVHIVLRDLLDYARAGQSREAEKNTARVSEAVEDIVALVRPQKDFREIELVSNVDPVLEVAMPISRLVQVLLNLLLNAGQAMQPKGGRVSIAAKLSGHEVEIVVEDDGPGVPEKFREEIFEPFFTTKDVGEGTGLGLSVCKGILASHGGRIRLDPSDKGARFVITLPKA